MTGALAGRRWSLALVAAGAAVLSFDALMVRLQTLTPPALLFWRGIFGAIGFGVVAAVAYRRETLSAFRAMGVGGWLVALLTAAGNISFVVSLSHTSVAHTVLIASAAPILTTVLAWFVLREKLLMRTWLAGGFVALGVAGIALSQPGRSELIGDLSAVVAAMSLSGVFIVQRFFHGVRQFAPMSLAGAATAVAALPFVENAALGLRNASVAWLDAAVALPLAIALITSYPDRIGASETSLLLLVETVLSPLWVWWVIRENPSEQTLVCGVLIVAALAAHSALQVRDELRPLDSRTGT